MKKDNNLKVLGIVALILAIAGGLWYVKKSTPPEAEPSKTELFPPGDELRVRSLDFFRRFSKLPSEMDPKILTESLHGGTAVFVGAYRMEFVVRTLNQKRSLWGLFLDNTKVYPVLPKDTEISIKRSNGEVIKLLATRNGFLSAIGSVPTVGETVQIFGKINGAGFSTTFVVPKLVKSFDVENQ